MDTISSDDFREAGFVPFRFRDANAKIEEDPTRLVHKSVPVASVSYADADKGYAHPVVRYEVGYGWEAKWGAVRFPIRSELELWRFMKQFEYPLPIDQKPNEST